MRQSNTKNYQRGPVIPTSSSATILSDSSLKSNCHSYYNFNREDSTSILNNKIEMDENDGGSSSSTRDVQEMTSVPLHFSKPLTTRNKHNKRTLKTNSCEDRKSSNSHAGNDNLRGQYNPEVGDKEIEKENTPLHQLSSLCYNEHHDMNTEEPFKHSKNSNFKPNLRSKFLMNYDSRNLTLQKFIDTSKDSLKQKHVKEVHSSDLEDQELIDIYCKSNHQLKIESTLLPSSSGRSNPAIPSADIFHYPPGFDIFKNNKVVFRPI